MKNLRRESAADAHEMWGFALVELQEVCDRFRMIQAQQRRRGEA